MNISVVIPSYNGAQKLPIVLGALSKQTIAPTEIVVVDDGSTDCTKEVVLQFRSVLPQLALISRENGGRSRVRNSGASASSCELLVFFDDDMEPAPDCLQQHLTHHKQHPVSILSGAQIDFWEAGLSDFRRFKKLLTEKWAADLRASDGTPLAADGVFMTAANCSMPRSLFLSLGGFDERLRDAEDYDFALRASQSGVPLFYNHKAFAQHHDRVTAASYLRRTEQYREAQLRLRQLFPNRENKYLAPPKPFLKRVFFRVFKVSCWVPLIDKGILKYLLPRFFRYRIYDWVITAHASTDSIN